MNKEDIIKKINEILIDIFDDDTIEISEDTVASDVDGWDSLMHINIIASIEKEFGISFSTKEVLGMKNVGDMADIILELQNK